MTTTFGDDFSAARRAASRANRLGSGVYNAARVLFWLLTGFAVVALIVIYTGNRYDGFGRTYTDWGSIWAGWGLIVGIWLAYTFSWAMIALVGSVAQAKAESLKIQISEAEKKP